MTEREEAEATAAERAILAKARSVSVPTKPRQLIEEIQSEHSDLSEIALREAFWRLVSRGELDWSDEREVRSAVAAGA